MMRHDLLSTRLDRRTAPGAGPAGPRSSEGRRAWPRVADATRRLGLVALSAIVMGAIAAPARAAEKRVFNDKNVVETTHTDWMRWIPDTTSLTELSIPGSHDTCTGQGLYSLAIVSKTQGLDLANQLASGIRVWDIRFRYDKGTSDLITGHGPYDCLEADAALDKDKLSLDFVFKAAETFLLAHPSETILMKIGDAGREDHHDDATDVDVTITALVDYYVATYQHVIWTPSGGTSSAVPIPTLGDVRGKIVLLATAAGPGGWKDGTGFRKYGPWFGDQVNQEDWEITYGQIHLQYERARDFVRDEANPRYDKDTGAYTGDTKLYFNQLNGAGKGVLFAPYDIANGTLFEQPGVNEAFTEYLLDQRNVQRTGVTMGDFFGGTLIDAIIAHNFRLVEPHRIAEINADVNAMVPNAAYHIDDEVGGGDNADERATMLSEIFTYFLPGQYVHAGVSKNEAWKVYIDDNNGVKAGFYDVENYSHILWLTETGSSSVSESNLQDALDDVVKTFKNGDGAGARKDAIVAELQKKFSSSQVAVLVHPEPGGKEFWSFWAWGVLASANDKDYIYKAMLTDSASAPPPDNTAPTASPTQSPAVNANGWNNTDVTVTWHWSDNAGGSGLDPSLCPASTTASFEGSIMLAENCNDLAGNTGEGTLGLKIDKTPPSITAALLNATSSASGWYTSDVRVHFTCTDDLSGIDPAGGCPTDVALTTEGASVSSPAVTAFDLAGNVSDPSNVVTVSLDKTAPTITAAALTAPNAAGWYNGDVTVAFTCTDAVSGIAAGTCPANQTLSAEGTVASQAVTVTDIAGNVSAPSNVVRARIDKTLPTITAAAVLAPGPTGWYTRDVRVHFTCLDAVSGIPVGNCPADQILSAEGPAVASTAVTVTDAAGNVSLPSNVVTVKIDKTRPTVTAAALTAPNAAGWYNGDVTVAFTCTDALSGIPEDACPASQTLRAEGAAVASLAVTVRDVAGNISAPSNVVTVRIDKTLPTITVAASAPTLYPANGKLVPDTFSGVVSDSLSGIDPSTVVFTVVDEYGTVQPTGPVALGPGGTYSFTLMLEAMRLGQDRDGRTYEVIVSGTDLAGNTRSMSAIVTVPHDQR